MKVIQNVFLKWEAMKRLIGSFTEADCIGRLLTPTNLFSESGLTLSCSTLSLHRLGLPSRPESEVAVNSANWCKLELRWELR
jgi:hypothetical protein